MNAAQLHRFLAIGLFVMAGGALVVRYLGVWSLPSGGDFSRVIAHTFAAISVVVVTVALVFLEPRVPERQAQQTVEERGPNVFARG